MASLVQIFYDPAAVFAKVRERGMWAPPLIASALITIVFGFYMSRTIGLDNVIRRFYDEHPSLSSQIPEDKKEEAIRNASSPPRVAMSSVMGGVSSVIITLIIAAILMAMLAIMDRKPDFPRILGATAWASFPFTVVTCVMGVLILLISKDPSELDPQSLFATNLGAFLDKNTIGRFAHSLASSLDVLTLGKIGFISYGTSKVTGVSMGSVIAVVAGLWLVWVMLKAGAAMAFGL